MNTKKIPIILIVILLATPQADAFWGFATKSTYKITKITKSSKALPDGEIIRLSKLSDETKGASKIGKKLDDLGLPNEVLEDTYMRIAIHQKKVTRKEAESMFSRLSDTPGFRTTLRKIIGNNAMGTTGHLNELRIADTASKHRFTVMQIGEKFDDGVKQAPTDIDIVLKKGSKYFAIEAKSNAPTTYIPMDKYRADLDTLVIYKNKHPNTLIPIFSITDEPRDPLYLQKLIHEADIRNVQLIFGSPQEQVVKIKLLDEIL